ncbi:MAG: hypothetical protein A3B10_04145 [Candidatus Doudnabacteria bacterium RIFCSPLOWO2_01_FULL_44_21]|uniref:Uncharacterized protein n=1 Tax=Candidatus Doudnabacteria bacterium RIFCSPLOWO2_01_FULL_44_21 TaxID=1817841 RepID=A0A1F5Q593_9BACT|nr:MAG: hypothetical protein A3B95_00375 [Candidatus Doudnabacteria bacterium RIFCSPHIGHO2_02_FULL_43_13b]OGE97306.1 MAG: hypothetical protein A3B10_04145 [Candidatus Doudnabacteria bacterium RIFCSPLOWO2_01_FULL_44_21]
MLTSNDIKQLSAVLATKEDLKDFYNKSEMDIKFNSLLTSVDNLANKFVKYHEEQIVLTHKLERIEDWIKKAAGKLGLDYNP